LTVVRFDPNGKQRHTKEIDLARPV